MSGFMIAGTSSGVGKTTVSMGLMAALSKRMAVQPFKVGPDYIDPAFHSRITGRICRNLDSYILSETRIKALYNENIKGSDIAIVEGVMGLFDGAQVGSDIGTSASIAKMLELPVILVVDGSKVASSIAATVKGFNTFDPNLKIAGVIINQVSGEGHYKLLKEAIEYHTDVKPCGYLKKNNELVLPERHLGLVPVGETELVEQMFEALAEAIEATIAVDALMALVKEEKTESQEILTIETDSDVDVSTEIAIGIAKDEAFNFYYEDSLNLLTKNFGVRWVPFSPMRDQALPDGIQGVYIGGGFPEVFAETLSQNKEMKASIREALEKGMPYVAECGGMMYLCDTLEDLEGHVYDMVGWLKGKTRMTKGLQRFGYAQLTLEEDCIYGKAGASIKVHEFHRSTAEVDEESVYDMKKIRHGEVVKQWRCGYKKGNGVAGYAHLHYGAQLEFGESFVKHCSAYEAVSKGQKSLEE